MKSVPLRRRLFLLAAACVLPLATMAAIALFALYQQTRDQAERSALEVARALSTAVDAEVRRSIAVLEALATSVALDDADIARFAVRARRAHATQMGWRALLLVDSQGRQVVNTSLGLDESLPEDIDREGLEATASSGKYGLGRLKQGSGGKWSVPLHVPVVRAGRARFVLTAMVDPAAFLQVLNRQRVPGEWVAAVAEASGLRVARTRSAQQSIGTPFSPTLRELISRGGDEGRGVTHNSEGEPVFTAYTRNPDTHWVTAVGLPVSAVELPIRHSFITFGGGIALSILLGSFAALVIARSINAPMAQLRESALAMGRGEPMALPDTAIREVQDVGHALARATQEREALLRREQAGRVAAETANRAKDEFLAMLGHELRNPLSAISNAASLLEHPSLDEPSRRVARDIIGRQIDHLTRLTDDLLDAGRAVMGKIVLQRGPLDLAAVTRQALGTLRASGRTAKHTMAESLAPAWVDADPMRLDQIISNLVSNAAKYSPAGSAIRVSVAREGSEAVLRVADSGIGIPADLASRVFDLFVQGDRELDRSLGGLGIGLTLVRRLAELHGGIATAASAGEGLGSEFTVRLPLIAEPAALVEPLTATAPSRGRDILLIEDNEDARESLQMLLSMAGHRVAVEADGEAGLATALRERPEILLVDVGLPKLDGYEVARRVRADPGWVRRPTLIAITGYGLPEDRLKALAAGFDEHMPKPVSPEELLSLIGRAGATST